MQAKIHCELLAYAEPVEREVTFLERQLYRKTARSRTRSDLKIGFTPKGPDLAILEQKCPGASILQAL
jgi:hypothetical protein